MANKHRPPKRAFRWWPVLKKSKRGRELNHLNGKKQYKKQNVLSNRLKAKKLSRRPTRSILTLWEAWVLVTKTLIATFDFNISRFGLWPTEKLVVAI